MKSNKETFRKETSKSNLQSTKSKSSSKTSEEEPKLKSTKNVKLKKEDKQKKSLLEKVDGSTSITISNRSRTISKNDSSEKKTSNSDKRGIIYMPKRNSAPVPKTTKVRATEDKVKKKTSKTKSEVVDKKKRVEKLKVETKETVIDYEDDFEDYESDFQEFTVSEISNMSDTESSELEPIEMQTKEKPQERVIHSAVYKKVEEEKRFDSGHYELTEARKRAKLDTCIPTDFKEEIAEIHDPFSRQLDSVEEKKVETKSLPLSTDEGFEEDRMSDFTKSPTNSQTSLTQLQKPKALLEEPKKEKCRAREIMNMIKLDTVQISLLECRPIPYEDFAKIFGKINGRQKAVQTKEDNLNTEIQTDDVTLENKWTQYPIICRSSLTSVEDIVNFQLEQLGVGTDLEQSSSKSLVLSPTYDLLKLNSFLNRAGKLILTLLERRKLGGNILQNEPHELTFSEGFVQLSITSLSFLSDRSVTNIQYSALSSKILMTIHPLGTETVTDDEETEEFTKYCIGCVWNISEPSQPIKLFYSRSTITSCCFHPMNYNIILGGTQDGTINIWNLTEDKMWHKTVTNKVNEIDWVLRSPSYTTSGNCVIDGHNSEIVGISVLTKFERNLSRNFRTKIIPIQICTLDSDGKLIIWSVLGTLSKNAPDINSSVWSEISLNKSQEIALNSKGNLIKEDVISECKHIKSDSVDSNQLYLVMNSFEVLRTTCLGTKLCPTVYKSNSLDVPSETTCIETCPFEKSYFMVGCKDGTVRLHCSNIEQSLLYLKAKNFSAPVLTIQWSKSKPFTLYILDDQSRIHVWDLGNSDVLPLQTLHVTKRGHIKSMQLSPCNTSRDLNEQYLAIGTSNGRVEVHKLKREFYYSQVEHINRETEAFTQYISIL